MSEEQQHPVSRPGAPIASLSSLLCLAELPFTYASAQHIAFRCLVHMIRRLDELAARSERGVSPARAGSARTERHWNNIDLFVYRDVSDLEIDCENDTTHTLIFSLAAGSALSDVRAAVRLPSELGEGHTIVSPAGARSSFRGSAAWLAVLRFGVPFLAHLAAGISYSEGASLGERTIWKPCDVFLDGCIRLMMAEMDAPGDLAQASMMEHLGTAVATHLIRLFGSRIVSSRSEVYVSRSRYLASVTQYIHNNIRMKISLQDLSKVAGMSPFHFSRLFKQATGLTPMAYLESRRIDRAKLLISEGAMSLSEVAYEVGFSDQSHFTRRFRRQTGMTPATFGYVASTEPQFSLSTSDSCRATPGRSMDAPTKPRSFLIRSPEIRCSSRTALR